MSSHGSLVSSIRWTSSASCSVRYWRRSSLSCSELTRALIVAGLSLPVLTLGVLPYLRALDEAAAVRARELAPVVNRLQLVPLFAGLAQTLEALAGAASEQRFPQET